MDRKKLWELLNEASLEPGLPASEGGVDWARAGLDDQAALLFWLPPDGYGRYISCSQGFTNLTNIHVANLPDIEPGGLLYNLPEHLRQQVRGLLKQGRFVVRPVSVVCPDQQIMDVVGLAYELCAVGDNLLVTIEIVPFTLEQLPERPRKPSSPNSQLSPLESAALSAEFIYGRTNDIRARKLLRILNSKLRNSIALERRLDNSPWASDSRGHGPAFAEALAQALAAHPLLFNVVIDIDVRLISVNPRDIIPHIAVLAEYVAIRCGDVTGIVPLAADLPCSILIAECDNTLHMEITAPGGPHAVDTVEQMWSEFILSGCGGYCSSTTTGTGAKTRLSFPLGGH